MPVTAYNRYSRILHWLIAGLILFMIFLGWRLDAHDSMRLSRVNLHKSVGILILGLSFVRLGLRFLYKAPPAVEGPKWEMFAAKALHVLFYIVMIGMPLSGWLMVSTSAREIPFFGLFPVPHLPVPQNHDTHEVFEAIHGLIAKLIIYGMVPLHVAAALKHQFINKDAVMAHMVPGLTPKPILNWRWVVPVGVIGLAIALGYGLYQGVPEKGGEDKGPPPPSAAEPSAAPVEAPSASSSISEVALSSAKAPDVTTWTIDKAASKISFATTFSGEVVNGGFSAYAATIVFDPAQLPKSHVKVTIDLASVNTGDGDRDSTLKSDSFFNTGVTPKAIFEANSFAKTDATHFVAKGKLTLHGVTKPLNLSFTLNVSDHIGWQTAEMSATTEIDRTAFGVGSGEYTATDSIPAKVKVKIDLKAKSS